MIVIFGSIIAPFGGFFASGLKRAYAIKDFGTSIPGHGGFLDRFDCHCVMAAFMFGYVGMVVYKSEISMERVSSYIYWMNKSEKWQIVDMLTQELYNVTMAHV